MERGGQRAADLQWGLAISSQPSDQLWLLPGQGQTRRDLVAEVAARLRTLRTMSFAVPEPLREAIRPGVRVVADGGGGRRIEGWCLRVSEQPWSSTRRPVFEAIDALPLISPPLLALAQWISEYYVCPPGAVIDAMLPAPVRKPPPRKPRKPKAEVDSAPVESPDFALTEGQAAALRTILVAMEGAPGDPASFGVHTLFGVPGSGKTEVYVRAIQAAIDCGRQSILLVPEIALATQVVDRLARRFERVAVIHSQRTESERGRSWRSIESGAVDVVIGTRTAVFAPCPRLGLIVVDEEQEGSFKNMAAPFYHARDVAIKRGQIESVPVLLGSATPSLETWWNSNHLPHFRLLRLPERVPGATLPQARIIDSRPRLGRAGGVLSEDLILALRETLQSGGQAVLLHNRRGYAAQLTCRQCGLRVNCPRCGCGMVHHRTENLVKCHHCGSRREAPVTCLDTTCGGTLEAAGLAIQRLEEELLRIVPEARIARLDRDTMKKRDDYAEALSRFERGEADLLIGTQMVAKGLDFPGVRLVGVLDADAMLALPDFRAAEHAFQLLVQVVGRAGRREGRSQALMQFNGGDPRVLRRACEMNYEAFAAEELAIRRELGYPPFGRLARIVLLDERAGAARDAAEKLTIGLREAAGRIHAGLRVFDPEPCAIARLREMLRWQVLIAAPRDGSLQRLLHDADGRKLLRPRVKRITIDVDALDMM